jgi:hypothetical protein
VVAIKSGPLRHRHQRRPPRTAVGQQHDQLAPLLGLGVEPLPQIANRFLVRCSRLARCAGGSPAAGLNSVSKIVGRCIATTWGRSADVVTRFIEEVQGRVPDLQTSSVPQPAIRRHSGGDSAIGNQVLIPAALAGSTPDVARLDEAYGRILGLGHTGPAVNEQRISRNDATGVPLSLDRVTAHGTELPMRGCRGGGLHPEPKRTLSNRMQCETRRGSKTIPSK